MATDMQMNSDTLDVFLAALETLKPLAPEQRLMVIDKLRTVLDFSTEPRAAAVAQAPEPAEPQKKQKLRHVGRRPEITRDTLNHDERLILDTVEKFGPLTSGALLTKVKSKLKRQKIHGALHTLWKKKFLAREPDRASGLYLYCTPTPKAGPKKSGGVMHPETRFLLDVISRNPNLTSWELKEKVPPRMRLAVGKTVANLFKGKHIGRNYDEQAQAYRYVRLSNGPKIVDAPRNGVPAPTQLEAQA